MPLRKKNIILLMFATLVLLSIVLPVFAATSVSVLDGQISVTGTISGSSLTGSGSTTVSNNVVTATAAGGRTSRETNTISITNTTGKAATITFSYSASNYSDFSESTASGTKSLNLAANETKEVLYIVGKKATTSNTATLTLSNFNYTAAADSSSVTFNFVGGTVTVDGNTISSGDTVDIASTGVSVVATPSSGYEFLGWVNGNTGNVMSTAKEYTVTPVENMSVKAAFAQSSSNAWFLVPSGTENYMYDDLNEAATKAATCDKIVVHAYDGTLLAGNYTIPAGVTLLIPNDSANTVYGATPSHDGNDSYTVPTQYRKLTMASGANITVNGAISIAGKIGTAMGTSQNGAPSGPVGFIEMASGSSITVNNGANLYAWGYITGSGSVEIKDGGTVYEAFQVRDWRGGSVTSAMVKNEDKVFPLSQYYIQNIQVPLTLNAGATEMVATAMTVTLVGVQAPCVEFIGDAGLYVVSSGYLIKDYEEATDDTVFTVKGDVSISNLSITMKTGVIGSITINSKDYVLPVRSGMIINIESGNITISQDMAICPGAEVNIAEGATITMGSGNSLYVYDADEWGKYCYFQGGGGVDSTYAPVIYVPTGRADRSADLSSDGKILVNGILDASAGGIYTTNGGGNICSDGTGEIILGANNIDTDLKTHQYSQVDDGDGYGTEEYIDITVTNAQLVNGNGEEADSYISPSVSNTYVYDADHDKWALTEHKFQEGVVTAEPTCTAEGVKTYTCSCDYTYTEPVAATGHSYTSSVTEPTCTDGGFTTYTCSGCDHSYTGNETSSLGHSYDDGVVTTNPTCTTEGVKTFTCGTCGDTKTEAVSATGHTSGETVIENNLDATCSESGSYDEVVYCTVCDAELSRETQTVDALGHSYDGGVVTTDPTCTEKGVKTYTCSGCGDTYTEAVAASGHSYDSGVVTAPTCTEKGYTTYTCSVCGDSYKANETAATGHTNAEAVAEKEVAATCSAAGSYDEVVYCTVCSAEVSRKTQTVDALGHEYGENNVCTRCNYVYDPVTVAYSMQAFLQLKSEVIMGVGFTLENLGEVDPTTLEGRVGLLIWDAAELPAEAEATVENCSYVIDSAKYNGNRFEALSNGIPAKNLGDALAFRAYYINENGEYVYGRIISSYSPKTYCYNKLNPDKDAETDNDALMVAILNYCTAAQKYFESESSYGYSANGNYINADLSDEQKALVWDDSLVRSDWTVPTEKEGSLTRNETVVTNRGANLTLKGAIDYTFYFKTSGIEVASAEILTWTEAQYNAAEVLTEKNATVYALEWVEANSRYEYVYKGLPAKDMFSPIYACAKITDTSGNVYYSGVIAYCPERFSYLNKDNANEYRANLAKWIVIYGDAARSYFVSH